MTHKVTPINVDGDNPVPVQQGPVRNEEYIASVGNISTRGPLPGYNNIVAENPDTFTSSPTAEQVSYLLTSWKEFVDGACRHPCTNVKQTGLMCPTQSCIDESVKDVATVCEEYTASTPAGCYCQDQLQGDEDSATTLDVLIRASAVAEDSKLCALIMENFMLAEASYYVMVLAVVVLNFVLGQVLKKLAMFRAPWFWSDYLLTASLTIFWARFVNNGLLVMVVNADGLGNLERVVPGLFFVLRYFGILDGSYEDFNSEWFGTIGPVIVFTMLLNIVQPHAAPLVKTVLNSVMIWLRKRSLLIQYDLDELYVGPDFVPESRYPEIMTTVFVCMLYSGGMPLLYVWACGAMFVTFWLDKLMLLRVYNRDKMEILDGKLANQFLRLLPWSLVIHLAFTIYMYGSNDAMYDSRWGKGLLVDLASDSNETSAMLAYATWLNSTAAIDVLDLQSRLMRVNTLPLLIMLALVVVAVVLRSIFVAAITCLQKALCPVVEYRPVHELQKDPARGYDDYTRDVEAPFTDDWVIWVLDHHMKEFYKYTANLGVTKERWSVWDSRDVIVCVN